MKPTSKCAHPACSCLTGEGKKYCSEVCADARRVTELTCQCQHKECEGAALKS
jgi:hypothetical protein